jgi:hypothetical protein
MLVRSLLTKITALALLALSMFALPKNANADDTILPGWDLLQTTPPTLLNPSDLTPPGPNILIPFVGVPLGTYDFGGSIGVEPVGLTDTIVQRLAPAVGPAPATIPIELVALQLMSVAPIDLGSGTDFHFVTLQSARGGPASSGSMTITFGPEAPPILPHGTFDSFFDVYFDIRIGALNGPIVLSNNLTLQSSGTPWNHEPPPFAVVIDDVNRNLNNTDSSNDFWPLLPIQEVHPGGNGSQHTAQTAVIPEATCTPLIMAGLGIAAVARRRRIGMRS